MARRFALALFVWVGLPGCGSEIEPVALADMEEATRAALCDWSVRCAHVPNHDLCQRLIDPKDYDTRRAQDAVAAGRLAFDDKKAATCLSDLRDAHCSAVPFSDRSCRYFVGLRAPGDGCTSDFECIAEGRCEFYGCDGQCCQGTCAAGEPPPPQTELAREGEACQGHHECITGTYCERDQLCTKMPETQGEPCLFGCGRGDLFCDIESLTCRAYAGLAEPCDTGKPCDPAWGFCDGVCRARPGAEEACDETRICVASTWCNSGSCQSRGAAGSQCSESEQCDVACDSLFGRCADYQTCGIGG